VDAATIVKVRRALISVSDKSGLVELARALSDAGVEIVSTGGTAAALVRAGIDRGGDRVPRNDGWAREDAAPARAWRAAGGAR
jgi:hypothetical protein